MADAVLNTIKEYNLLDSTVVNRTVSATAALANNRYQQLSNGIAVVLYCKTKEGTILGSGAHPGYVVDVDFEILNKLGLDYRNILDASDEDYLKQDGSALKNICEECFKAAGNILEEDWDKLNEPIAGAKCWSCVQMLYESLTDKLNQQ